VFVVAALAAWMTRDLWLHRLTGRTAESTITWTRVTTTPAAGARERVTALGAAQGPVYATLTPEEVAAMLLAESGGRLPPSVSDAEAAATGDQLSLRANVNLSELRSAEDLGALRTLLTGRQRVTVTGTPSVLEAGVGRFRVDELKVGELIVPQPLVSRILAQIDRDQSPSRAAEPGITFPLPRYVGDIRVSNGQVTLYKTTP
jgi:hypothetical protein